MLVSPSTKPGGWSIRGRINGRAEVELFFWRHCARSGIERAAADAKTFGYYLSDVRAVATAYAYCGDGSTWRQDMASARADSAAAGRNCVSAMWIETGEIVTAEAATNV